MSSIDWSSARPDQIEGLALRQVTVSYLLALPSILMNSRPIEIRSTCRTIL